ncbi:MAG TPA: PP2C family protein-serine/threonine phosphatase [Acidimicrobiales bacterium]|nr:PP2C family protein-serine/threonine phosphatase [Acidimicrobiales bacterium]
MDSDLLQTPTSRSHFEQVAAALSPLRASSSRTSLANAVARLVTGAAMACRVDVVAEEGSGGGIETLSRMIRPERLDLADADSDLGLDEARAGRAAVVVDVERDLSWVVIPLVAHRATAGALRVALASSAGPTPGDLAHLHHIASSLAIGLSSAELHEQSERISRRLQESLLPQALPTNPWFDVAARYVPATAGMHVGGDWYDAELLTTDELAISVGDVAGHGVEAAARMGELRSAMHAFRLLSRAPDALIALLHRLCEPPGYFATAICARLDPSGGFRWASAGHLPPILARTDGTVEALFGPQSPPLGAGVEGDGVRLCQHEVEPGDLILLYTDGLIERRDEPIDVSIERLSAEVARQLGPGGRAGPDALLDGVLTTRQASGPTADDIAVIAVRLLGFG